MNYKLLIRNIAEHGACFIASQRRMGAQSRKYVHLAASIAQNMVICICYKSGVRVEPCYVRGDKQYFPEYFPLERSGYSRAYLPVAQPLLRVGIITVAHYDSPP